MFEFSHPALFAVNFPLDFSLDFPGSLDSVAGFITQLQSAIASAIQHPFLAILALLVGIGLLQLIADLVKRILKASIAFILTLPVNLSQWIWKRATTSSKASKETQIEQLIDQLETLRAEEAQIITELKGLLSSAQSSSSKASRLALFASTKNQDSLEAEEQTTHPSIANTPTDISTEAATANESTAKS